MTRSPLNRTTAKCLVIVGCVLGGSAATVPTTHAVPVVFGTNAYEFVQVANPFPNNTWTAASNAAAASVFNGVNGHLATVTSQAENDFLISLVPLVPGFNGAWLGGDHQGWLEGPEAGNTFAQVGGFTNWNPLEPNNAGLMYMSIGTSTPNSGATGAGNWLDDSGTQGVPDPALDPVIGYFVEFENAAAIPEPTTLALMAIGLAGAAGIARRRKLAA